MVIPEINLSHPRAAVSSTLTAFVPQGPCTGYDSSKGSLTSSPLVPALLLSLMWAGPCLCPNWVCVSCEAPPTFLAVFGSASVAMTTAQLLPPAEPTLSSLQGLRAPPPRSFLLPPSASTLLRDSCRLRHRRSSLPLSSSCLLLFPADSFLQESWQSVPTGSPGPGRQQALNKYF